MNKTILLQNECGLLQLDIQEELKIEDVRSNFHGITLFNNIKDNPLRIELYEYAGETITTLYCNSVPHDMIVICAEQHKIYHAKVNNTEQTIYQAITMEA